MGLSNLFSSFFLRPLQNISNFSIVIRFSTRNFFTAIRISWHSTLKCTKRHGSVPREIWIKVASCNLPAARRGKRGTSLVYWDNRNKCGKKGETSRRKTTEDASAILKETPKGDQSGRGPGFFLPLKETMFKTYKSATRLTVATPQTFTFDNYV